MWEVVMKTRLVFVEDEASNEQYPTLVYQGSFSYTDDVPDEPGKIFVTGLVSTLVKEAMSFDPEIEIVSATEL